MPDKVIDFDDSSLDVFDNGQRDSLITMLSNIEDGVTHGLDSRVADAIKEAGLDSRVINWMQSQAGKTATRDFDARFQNVYNIWKNNGCSKEHPEHRFTLEELGSADKQRSQDYANGKLKRNQFIDTQFALEQPMLIPKVISQIVREAVEPNIVLTGLLQRINFQIGSTLTFPAMGAFTAADIPEGGEYPEQTLEFAGEVTSTIGKSGVAVKFTDEMLRYSLFDVMSLHLTAAGRALTRHKEQKVANMITDNGLESFNNTSANGTRTTGRSITGAANGTLGISDLFDMYAAMGDAGYTPNALIMHPFGWLAFAQNPSLREFGFANNGAMFQTRGGGVGSGDGWRVGGLHQETKVTDPGAIATTQSPIWNSFPVPLQIIISPFVPYTASNLTTDIWMVDTNELGVLVVDEEVITEEFDDPARDIRKIKLRERYAVSNINAGQGIRIAKSVVVGRNYAIDEKISWDAASSGLSELNDYTGDVGL